MLLPARLRTFSSDFRTAERAERASARTVESATGPTPVVQQPGRGKAHRTAQVSGADWVLPATTARFYSRESAANDSMKVPVNALTPTIDCDRGTETRSRTGGDALVSLVWEQFCLIMSDMIAPHHRRPFPVSGFSIRTSREWLPVPASSSPRAPPTRFRAESPRPICLSAVTRRE
jgi:hypothetical protein